MQDASYTAARDEHNPVLRWTLLGDAVAVGSTGLIMFAAAGRLSDWLDLPAGLLRWPGLFLIFYAATVGWYAARPVYARRAIQLLIAVNLAWAIGCLVILVSGEVDSNGLGVAFILLNAVACLIVATLEVANLPR